MKIKEKIITSLICLIAIALFAVINGYQNVAEANKIYNVYLDGKVIGAITDKDALYSLIDEKQQSIKDKYHVNNVYPPSGLQIVENYAYDTKVAEINNIYQKTAVFKYCRLSVSILSTRLKEMLFGISFN